MPKSSSDLAAQTMIDNMPEKTGKSLEQWFKILAKQKFEKHGEIVKWLKSEHAVTHGFANQIALLHRDALTGDLGGADDLVAAQYKSPKESLRPIYDEIIKVVTRFGNDLEVAPKKAYVSLRRKKQFALVQPSTKTRIDVGINLKGKEPTARLEVSGSFNAMVSHRVRVTNISEVDAELKGWLKEAYDAS